MTSNNFQMPSKQKMVKRKKTFNRRFWWIVIKLLILIFRFLVRILGDDNFDDPNSAV